VVSGPSLELLRRRLAEGVPPGRGDEDSVRRQWWAALATLQEDFLLPLQPLHGVWLASPLPALYEPELVRQLRGWVWAPAEIGALLQPAPALLPGAAPTRATQPGTEGGTGFERLPLRPDDGTDPFLLVITRRLQLALALEGPPQERRLLVRFDPATLSAALRLLDERLEQAAGEAAGTLRETLRELGPLRSDDGLALKFWPRLGERLAAMAPSVTLQPLVHGGGRPETSSELALLEALTHEVRTPLATIRTLIRSLLRRDDLPGVVRQRLEQIDSECSEQIDRFGLIFHAAELQRQPRGQQELARTDLAQLLLQLEELWQRQLGRRGLTLRLEIAEPLPPVLSDPNRLETMLGGLIDRFIRGLPAGGTVVIRLQPAGPRLKLQLSCADQPATDRDAVPAVVPPERPHSAAVGPVLSWNPLTGSLQLSRQATQRLFHSLGGRLTERAGSGLTVFFPVAGSAAHDA
jgi:signal transduction histidine kinase